MLSDVGIVIIGRNEGERLRAAIESCVGQTAATIYVDSGSTDGSLSLAATLGANVVNLDASTPFTAARARNEGMARLLVVAPAIQFVQFLDGDCTMTEGWLTAARDGLLANLRIAAVCGRRRERHPNKTIYNQLMDLEWNTPIGPAKSVGGDAMFRVSAFSAVAGFDATIVAGEEPELCLRLREAGWTILRLDAGMTTHDANMLTFAQWWRRQFRSGYGAADVNSRHMGEERLFAKMLWSSRIWTAGWLLAEIVCRFLFGWAGVLIPMAILIVQIARITMKTARPGRIAIANGILTIVSKWAMLFGQIQYFLDRRFNRQGRRIEYKQPVEGKP